MIRLHLALLTVVFSPLFAADVALAAELWSHPLDLSSEAQGNEHVALVAVRRGHLTHMTEAPARVEAEASRVVSIQAAGSGKVTAVAVMPGQAVHKGQTLVSYTDHSLHELYLQRQQVLAALDSARAGMEEANLLYKRGQALVGASVSTGELQRRRMTLQQQRGLVAAREADLATLDHRQKEEFTSVTERIVQDEASDLISPVDGVVQTVNAAVAADITAGDRLVTVADLSRLWLVADLSPEDAEHLSVGGAAQFRPAGEPLAAPIDSMIGTIAGLTDPATGLVRVVCDLNSPVAGLRPGMMLDAAFVTGKGIEGLIVPLSALEEIEGKTIVFVQETATHFFPVDVAVVERDSQDAVVSGDLSPGKIIVSTGSFALKSMLLLDVMMAD